MSKEKITKIPAKPGENQDTERDDNGRFIKGVSGNPEGGSGRPKGSISITSRIREELNRTPDGQKITYLDALIKKIFKKAIVDEDPQMIKILWGYIDGMPKQSLEHSGEQEINISWKD